MSLTSRHEKFYEEDLHDKN